MELKDIVKIFTPREEIQLLDHHQMNAISDVANIVFLKDGRIEATFMDNTIVISHEQTRGDDDTMRYWVARRLVR